MCPIKIFDINNPKVTQKMAGYLAGQVRTREEAMHLCNMEARGLKIFACAAGVINATDTFEMNSLQHALQECLHPLRLTQEMREFATAPTPPPRAPYPFPPGLFSPLATPPQPNTFRFQVPGETGHRAPEREAYGKQFTLSKR